MHLKQILKLAFLAYMWFYSKIFKTLNSFTNVPFITLNTRQYMTIYFQLFKKIYLATLFLYPRSHFLPQNFLVNFSLPWKNKLVQLQL